MTILKTLAVAAVLATPLSAQALNEPFNTSTSGVFPPAGWAVTLLPGHVAIPQWDDTALMAYAFNGMTAGSVSAADAAGHPWDSGLSDDRLSTFAMDFSSYGAPQLTYDGALGYAAYMSHTSIYTGYSYIEVSTDGGLTWTIVWTEASTVDYYTPGITLDLSSYAGNSNVMLGFHYIGDFAHEWGLDNLVVDNVGPTGPSLSSTGSVGGPMTFNFANFTPNGQAAVVYGPAGTLVVPGGPCAGITVGVLPLNFPPVAGLILVGMDGAGAGQLTRSVPAAGAGLTVQAVDVLSCGVSNTVGL